MEGQPELGGDRSAHFESFEIMGLDYNSKPIEISSVLLSSGDSSVLATSLDAQESKEIVPEITPVRPSSPATDIMQKIVRQVEYYFSDENLPTDKFMLKYVKKNKEGYVPIGVIASFRRMKKLVEDDDALIAAALRTSSQLVVSKEGKRVKRLHPLPPPAEPEDRRPCTVVVENLPLDCSEESLQPTFGASGQIQRISIRHPGSTQEEDSKISSKLHALVEYTTPAAAEHAVASLNDEKNWRSGLRVELLLKRMGRLGLVPRARRPGPSGHEAQPGGDNVPGLDAAEAAGPEAQQGRRKARGKGGPRSHQPVGPTKAPPVGPRMPDGTRGFTMGRGKALLPAP
ncbi:la-related protein 6A-like [Wolffia australiana]